MAYPNSGFGNQGFTGASFARGFLQAYMAGMQMAKEDVRYKQEQAYRSERDRVQDSYNQSLLDWKKTDALRDQYNAERKIRISEEAQGLREKQFLRGANEFQQKMDFEKSKEVTDTLNYLDREAREKYEFEQSQELKQKQFTLDVAEAANTAEYRQGVLDVRNKKLLQDQQKDQAELPVTETAISQYVKSRLERGETVDEQSISDGIATIYGLNDTQQEAAVPLIKGAMLRGGIMSGDKDTIETLGDVNINPTTYMGKMENLQRSVDKLKTSTAGRTITNEQGEVIQAPPDNPIEKIKEAFGYQVDKGGRPIMKDGEPVRVPYDPQWYITIPESIKRARSLPEPKRTETVRTLKSLLQRIQKTVDEETAKIPGQAEIAESQRTAAKQRESKKIWKQSAETQRSMPFLGGGIY